MKSLHFSSALLLALCACGIVSAEGWGTIKGKFVVDGKVPPPAELNITKDKAVCTKKKLFDENLLVGPDGGLKNVCVWVSLGRRDPQPPVHPSYEGTANEAIQVDNLACAYVPHVAVVRPSQKVEFTNSDPIAHNFKVDGFANNPFNSLVPAGGTYEHQFTSEERVPMVASCSIHPWMTGYIVCKESPYVAVSAEDGTFEIKNMPAGEWNFQFWHTSGGYLGEVTMGGKKEKDRKGEYEVEVEDGETTDLGVITVSADILTK
ncbi:cupredoxin domain-containing protein [Blastopirellula retiformator]|uniref:Rhamnogalacturonan lyase domain-containing protein n=1 Tax=Blastopirellula retiformator TaxID=2527970 RepID=A0A5C5VMD6_9BACT|nr:hypothetical protein [Blastopirellula retiformator]TWT39688.1 hypothetical protein Enr8_13890 [Blastopirellula retiformator]